MIHFIITAITSLILCISLTIDASDHVDGPITINNPVADISDLFVFPSPQQPGNLVLILNSYPFVPRTGHFSDRLVYSLVVRPVSVAGKGLKSGFQVGITDYRFDCTFDTPHENDKHSVNCVVPGDRTIKGEVNQIINDNISGIRLFTGRRSDSFLFNSSWFNDVVFNRMIPPADASNDIARLNVLSIILEIDLTRVFNPQSGNMFAVTGEISHRHNKDNNSRIIDRIGRPEISNARLVARAEQDDLRDQYNQEHTFKLNNTNRTLYSDRISENIDYYDSLDGSIDWQPEWKRVLTRLLVNDYLVVDMDKKFSTQGYFDIEQSMLGSQPHTRSGGRVPGDHVINTLISYMVNGGHAQAISDGITINTGLPSMTFPYLAEPDTGVISIIKRYFARKAAQSLSLKKRTFKHNTD